MEYIFLTIIVLLGFRTLLWHLQNWQIREYRTDRMLAYLQTKEGFKNIINLWFFRGIFPRPKFSGRIFMIIGIFLIINVLILWAYINFPQKLLITHYLLFILLLERLIWLIAFIAVFLSKIPVWISREILFFRAKKTRNFATNLTVIGIAGSYGKSTTKEILVHLLQKEFGKKNVLFNPENQNNEIAIARLIRKNSSFFKSKNNERSSGSRGFPEQANTDDRRGSLGETGFPRKTFFVVEVGAYRQGEITKVCRFIQPHIGILTGLNAQHIELFGSQKNIQKAKFEMAENASEKVFFNRDNALLSEIFEDRKIQATKIALSQSVVKNIKSLPQKTTFELYDEAFLLPWPGTFFVSNALLALECARECGINRKKLPKYLNSLPALERALTIESFGKGSILWDLYSANPDGVLSAIEHLSGFSGKKIFIGIPLRELGTQAEDTHGKIFQALSNIKAEVFWCKSDFAYLGKSLCGKRFHLISKDRLSALKKCLKTIEKNDAILCESKLPKFVLEVLKK